MFVKVAAVMDVNTPRVKQSVQQCAGEVFSNYKVHEYPVLALGVGKLPPHDVDVVHLSTVWLLHTQ